jgi:hypothetical protein
MKLIGIDPGAHGALVELDVNEKMARWIKLPWREDGVMDDDMIYDNFSLIQAHYIYLEKVTPNKLFGCSNFSFGKNFGHCLDLIKRYPYTLVSPRAWQRRFNGNVEEKTAKLRTKSSFRKMNPSFGKIIVNQHEGLIDAFFIAYFAGIDNNVVMPRDWNFVEVI